jgi:hypothetical protein
MWVWHVSRSEGGSLPATIARAKRNGIGTVYIKAGDGGGAWGQFTPGLVQSLHRGGLDVCAWQFVASRYRLEVTHPLLKRGSKGDLVVWAQERLIGSGAELTVNGIYGKRTIAADGRIGTGTWDALLDVTPYRMQWSASPARSSSSGAVISRERPAHRPLSASLAPKADEIQPLRPGGP